MNIETSKDMTDAVKWLEGMLSACTNNMVVWGIPRSTSVYTIYRSEKTYSKVGSDPATDLVLAEAGYTLIKGD